MSQRYITAVMLLLIAWTGGAWAGPKGQYWDVAMIARSHGSYETLHDATGKPLGKFPVRKARMLMEVFDDISEAAELRPNFYITTGSAPNAFATDWYTEPMIAINFAMLRLIGNDRDMLAAVIGHEIAHLKLEHMVSNAYRMIPKAFLEAYLKDKHGNSDKGQWGLLGLQMVDTKFNRDQERASDYLGVIWAVESGYKSEGAAQLWYKMYRLHGDYPVPFLSTHPVSSERIRVLSDMGNRLRKD